MPPLGTHSPFAASGRVMAPAETDPLSPLRDSFFEAGPANLLLSQANRARLAVWPTLPAMFQGDGWLADADYQPGARGAPLGGAANAGWCWVSEKGPWLRRNRLLRRPRTLIVTGGGFGAYAGGAGPAIDSCWDAIDAGGWEVALVRPALHNGTVNWFWGTPCTTSAAGTAHAGDFAAGAFGELCLVHLARAEGLADPFRYAVTGGTSVLAEHLPPPEDLPNDSVYGHQYFTYTAPDDFERQYYATVRYDPVRLASGPAFWGEVAARCERFRLVLVNGEMGESAAFPALDHGLTLCQDILPAPAAAGLFTGLSPTVLSLAFDRDTVSPTFEARAGAVLAGWLADNLND